MAKKLLDFQWPLGGLDESRSYQAQQPFTTVDAQNVRPSGSLEGRARGGSRPGIARSHYLKNASLGTATALGSGSPIRLLDQCTVARTDGQTTWTDNFLGSTLGTVWTAATWGTIAAAPGVTGDLASVSSTTGETGCTRDAISDLSTSSDYQLEMFIVPFQADHHGKYQFFLRMGAGLDASADGVIVELVLESAAGAMSGTVKSYSSSVIADSLTMTDPGTDTVALPGWFKVLISGNNISCYWRGYTVLASTALTEGAAGARFGFGINCTQSGGTCLVDTFRVQYVSSTTGTRKYHTYLVASSNGTAYKDNLAGEMVAISATPTLASDRLLSSAQRGGLLYVADTSDVFATGTDGVRGTGDTKFDSATYADWSTLSLDTNNHVLEITSATGDLINGTYAISTVASGELTLATTCASGATGTCTFRILRGPKIINPFGSTITALLADSSKGQVPVGCSLVCLYRDRLVFAGDPDNPQVWYMSRQGTLTDFLYTDTDSQRAVAGTSADAGRVGEPVLALIPHGDDYLVFGCSNSIWVLRGDPAFGGQLDSISREIGVVSAQAWTRTPEGMTVFLSRDGIYALGSVGQPPTPISKGRLPERLKNLDASQHYITLQYDLQEAGIHVFVTPIDKGTTQYHWWFDWEFKSFWPVVLDKDQEPTASHRFVSEVASETGVILGSRDGRLRKFTDLAEEDDGTAITSYCLIGPIRMGGSDYNEGLLTELFAVTDEQSGDVDIDVLVGSSAEAAKGATKFESVSYTFNTAGLNYKHRPRARGHSLYLKVLNGESRRHWGVERIGGVIKRAGRQRLA